MAPDEIAARLSHLERQNEENEKRRAKHEKDSRARRDRQHRTVLWGLSGVVVPSAIAFWLLFSDVRVVESRLESIENNRYTPDDAKHDREWLTGEFSRQLDRKFKSLETDVREIRKSVEMLNRNK